jgi:hypothetical protein
LLACEQACWYKKTVDLVMHYKTRRKRVCQRWWYIDESIKFWEVCNKNLTIASFLRDDTKEAIKESVHGL